jgi:hypothetical protein
VVYGYFIPPIHAEAEQYIKNMNFFLRHGVTSSAAVDFLFLRIEGSDDSGVKEAGLRRQSGGTSDQHQPGSKPLSDDAIEWSRVSHLPNVYLCRGVNLGADICSYREFFHDTQQAAPRPLNHYNFLFFVNCGARGPFFYPPPPASLSAVSTPEEQAATAKAVVAAWRTQDGKGSLTARDRAQEWLSRFTDKLGDMGKDGKGMDKGDMGVGKGSRGMQGGISLIGPTVSCELHPHVQSYALAMTAQAYRDFADESWSGCQRKDKAQIILDAEVGLSKAVLEAGQRVGSFYPKHADIGAGAGFGGGTLDEWTKASVPVGSCEGSIPCEGSCPLTNPTIQKVADAASYPTLVGFVKFGGQIFQEGQLHRDTVRVISCGLAVCVMWLLICLTE